MSVFSLDHFKRFCSHLRIDSKELGQVPLTWLGTQHYAMQEVARGIDEGIHTFLMLKGRQLGISTITIALDLYWMFLHKGLQGALVTDTDDNRDLFRSYLAQYHRSLPANARVKVEQHNRAQLVLKNRSRLSYIVAGKRKNESLGAGKAVNFMHGTECASWGDQEGMGSLIATLAQQNPNRLYVFESTAFGYNMWYELCEQAKVAKSQRLIFIGWWRNNLYRLERNTLQFKTYWDGEPTPDEKEWMREIFLEYKVNVTPEQLAWWRWTLAENIPGSEINQMYQQYPPTAEYAFQMSGSKYFSSERVNVMFKRAMEQKRKFFRYEFGLHFEQTKFLETSEQSAHFSQWEEPVEGAEYVIGADPAYGSSEWADLFAISVFRCYADKIVQVAELATADLNEAQFAWCLAHLAGSYNPCTVVLEMQGPGGAVFNELQNLRRYAGAPGARGNKGLYDVVNNIRDYLWRKQDSIAGGFALQWQTTPKEKLRMMATLRNYFEREMLVINSPECAAQFRNISRDGDQIGGAGRAKDDLVIAAALGVVGWNDAIMQYMQYQGRTHAFEHRPKGEDRNVPAVERAVMKFMQRQGIRGPGSANQ